MNSIVKKGHSKEEVALLALNTIHKVLDEKNFNIPDIVGSSKQLGDHTIMCYRTVDHVVFLLLFQPVRLLSLN